MHLYRPVRSADGSLSLRASELVFRRPDVAPRELRKALRLPIGIGWRDIDQDVDGGKEKRIVEWGTVSRYWPSLEAAMAAERRYLILGSQDDGYGIPQVERPGSVQAWEARERARSAHEMVIYYSPDGWTALAGDEHGGQVKVLDDCRAYRWPSLMDALSAETAWREKADAATLKQVQAEARGGEPKPSFYGYGAFMDAARKCAEFMALADPGVGAPLVRFTVDLRKAAQMGLFGGETRIPERSHQMGLFGGTAHVKAHTRVVHGHVIEVKAHDREVEHGANHPPEVMGHSAPGHRVDVDAKVAWPEVKEGNLYRIHFDTRDEGQPHGDYIAKRASTNHHQFENLLNGAPMMLNRDAEGQGKHSLSGKEGVRIRSVTGFEDALDEAKAKHEIIRKDAERAALAPKVEEKPSISVDPAQIVKPADIQPPGPIRDYTDMKPSVGMKVHGHYMRSPFTGTVHNIESDSSGYPGTQNDRRLWVKLDSPLVVPEGDSSYPAGHVRREAGESIIFHGEKQASGHTRVHHDTHQTLDSVDNPLPGLVPFVTDYDSRKKTHTLSVNGKMSSHPTHEAAFAAGMEEVKPTTQLITEDELREQTIKPPPKPTLSVKPAEIVQVIPGMEHEHPDFPGHRLTRVQTRERDISSRGRGHDLYTMIAGPEDDTMHWSDKHVGHEVISDDYPRSRSIRSSDRHGETYAHMPLKPGSVIMRLKKNTDGTTQKSALVVPESGGDTYPRHKDQPLDADSLPSATVTSRKAATGWETVVDIPEGISGVKAGKRIYRG
ncbi:MAG: hypothetical protein WC911_01895 [Thermoleophilia bacterium]